MKTVITRHQAYTDYLLHIGLIKDGDYKVIAHAATDDIKGQDIITSGLPLHLAALANTVTVVPLYLPADLRGVELNVKQVADHAGNPQTFKVSEG